VCFRSRRHDGCLLLTHRDAPCLLHVLVLCRTCDACQAAVVVGGRAARSRPRPAEPPGARSAPTPQQQHHAGKRAADGILRRRRTRAPRRRARRARPRATRARAGRPRRARAARTRHRRARRACRRLTPTAAWVRAPPALAKQAQGRDGRHAPVHFCTRRMEEASSLQINMQQMCPAVPMRYLLV